jgi:hypothetical protein
MAYALDAAAGGGNVDASASYIGTTVGLTNVVPTAGLRRRRRSSHFAQQMRCNSALGTRTNHHGPALLLWCNGLLRKGSWWALWRGSLDGMQGVRVNHQPAAKRPSSAWSAPGERPTELQDQAAWRDHHRRNNAACRSVGPDRELVSPLVAQHELAVAAGDVQHQPTGDSLALVQRQLIRVEERVEPAPGDFP